MSPATCDNFGDNMDENIFKTEYRRNIIWNLTNNSIIKLKYFFFAYFC